GATDQPGAGGTAARSGQRRSSRAQHRKQQTAQYRVGHIRRLTLCLEYAEWLRRRRRINDAKPVLAEALATVRRLGARACTKRAETELRACGVAVAGGLGQPDALRERSIRRFGEDLAQCLVVRPECGLVAPLPRLTLGSSGDVPGGAHLLGNSAQVRAQLGAR